MADYKTPKIKIKNVKVGGYSQKGQPSSPGMSMESVKGGTQKAKVSEAIKLTPPQGATTYRKAGKPEFQRKDAQMETGEATDGMLEKERLKNRKKERKYLDRLFE